MSGEEKMEDSSIKRGMVSQLQIENTEARLMLNDQTQAILNLRVQLHMAKMMIDQKDKIIAGLEATVIERDEQIKKFTEPELPMEGDDDDAGT